MNTVMKLVQATGIILAICWCRIDACSDDLDCDGFPPCPDLEDGTVIDFSCAAYTECRACCPVIVDCSSMGLVFNEATGKCDERFNVDTTCKFFFDCTGLKNDDYAIYDTSLVLVPCSYFYTCLNGAWIGSHACAEGTLFDFYQHVCVFPSANTDPLCLTDDDREY